MWEASTVSVYPGVDNGRTGYEQLADYGKFPPKELK